MQPTPVHHRLPRAGIDPIDTADKAFTTIVMAIQRPLRPETVVAYLDHERRGIAFVIVSETTSPDSVIDVVECLCNPNAHDGRVGALLVGSVRPDGDIEHSDVDRWLEMSNLCEESGIELLEWFVIGRAVSCPRDSLGEPPRF